MNLTTGLSNDLRHIEILADLLLPLRILIKFLRILLETPILLPLRISLRESLVFSMSDFSDLRALAKADIDLVTDHAQVANMDSQALQAAQINNLNALYEQSKQSALLSLRNPSPLTALPSNSVRNPQNALPSLQFHIGYSFSMLVTSSFCFYLFFLSKWKWSGVIFHIAPELKDVERV
jgi:hypothetical protein